jgi:hypothetical protein
MVARNGKKEGSRKVKSLGVKVVSAAHAKVVKGGPTAVELRQIGVNWGGGEVGINWGDKTAKHR